MNSVSSVPASAARSSQVLSSVRMLSLGTVRGRVSLLTTCANQALAPPTMAPTRMPCHPRWMVAAPATAPTTTRYGMVSRPCRRSSLGILSKLDSKMASTTKMMMASQ